MITELTDQHRALLRIVREDRTRNVLTGGDDVDERAFSEGADLIMPWYHQPARSAKLVLDSPLALFYANSILHAPGGQFDYSRMRWGRAAQVTRHKMYEGARCDLNSVISNEAVQEVERGASLSLSPRSYLNRARADAGSGIDPEFFSELYGSVRSRVQFKPLFGHRVPNSDRLGRTSSSIASDSPVFVDDHSAARDFYSRIGVSDGEYWKRFREYLRSGIFWAIFAGDAVLGCRRPVMVKRDQAGAPHCETGPAARWRDGYRQFFLSGVGLSRDRHARVTAKSVTLAEILMIDDADVRAVALRYSPEALHNSNAALIDRSTRGNELFLIEKTEVNEFFEKPAIYLLRMKCPTGRVFVEGVDPEFAAQNPRADACQAQALRLTEGQYRNLAVEG